MKRYEIYDKDEGGALRFDLRTVVLELPEHAHFGTWNLTHLEAVGPDILSVEAEVAKREGGISLSWFGLLTLAATFEQVTDLRLSAATQPTMPKGDDGAQQCLIIEVFDSTFWAIETNIEKVQLWVRKSFDDVRPV